ncbi:MAG: TonB-dependent receptor [Acidobacteriota bacterium]|nr:TonB-dependent receptor [Acidobacteriota bacterium]
MNWPRIFSSKWLGRFRIFVVFLVLITTATVVGYTATGTSSISIRIFDARGGVMQKVKVTLKDQETGAQHTAVTNELGVHSFENLRSASYHLSAEKKNFESAVQEIHLSTDEDLPIELTLSLDPRSVISDRVMVVGSLSNQKEIPGSSHYIDPLQLSRQKLAFDDIHAVLQQVPGVNVQGEDGYGLRPNIGMRGSSSERSSKITLMEDGVLIAPAPYAAPSAYYFPVTGRMEAIEVRKGSSQIKYGPRTTGGVLNLISTSIPREFSLEGDAVLGVDNTRKVHLNVGDAYKNFAWVAETYQMATDGFKELKGGDSTGFSIGDYLAKFRLHSDADDPIYQELEVKLGKTNQTSNETYLGLTDADFDESPLRRYSGSQEDIFNSNHEQYQARYFVVPTKNLDVTTTVYRNNFHRNWYKLQSVSGASISKILGNAERYSAALDIARGADSSPDALAVRANNRNYYSQGVQTVLALHFDGGGFQNNVDLGLRYHEDQEARLQHEDKFQMVNGNMILTSKGSPGSQSNRISEATAWAFHMQDRIKWGRWTFGPGFRYEKIKLSRFDFSGSDLQRQNPTKIRTNSIDVFVPGMGISFQLNSALGFLGGVHKGFSPPGPGSKEDTESEKSLNYELGFRFQNRGVGLEMIGFANDYDNLLGADTMSAGGSGQGDLFNGGEVLVRGLEVASSFDLGHAMQSSVQLPVRFAYTFTAGHFGSTFASQFKPWGQVVAGDEIPYLPRHQFHASLGLEKDSWRLELDATAISKTRTSAGKGFIPSVEATDQHLVLNFSGEYDLMSENQGVSLFLTVRNLANKTYIVARRPAGVRPGLPRAFVGGIRFRLGR